MNKRYIALVSAALLLLNLSACGCQRSVTEETQAATMKATEEPTAAPTEFTLPEGEGVEELPVELEETVNVTESTEATTKPTESKNEATPTEPKETAPAETTAPTVPTVPEETTAHTVPTVPEETTAPTVPTVPEETTAPTEPSGSGNSGYCCKYAEYLTWSASAQQNFMNSFASPLDYIEWCRAGEAAHANHDTSIKVEGGNLNVGDYIG